MTVGDLIKSLEMFDPQTPVVLCDDWGYRTISNIEEIENCHYYDYFHGTKIEFAIYIK